MKRILISSVFLIAIGVFIFGGVSIAADGSYGLDATAGAADLKKYGQNVPVLIGNVIGTALSLVSVIFFILAVYGGFRMMLARGKEEDFTKGKDILIHAIIGLIIILASYAITSFIFGSVKPGAGTSTPTPTPTTIPTPTPPTTPTVDVPHCLTAEKVCVTGGGECSGTLYDSKSECETNIVSDPPEATPETPPEATPETPPGSVAEGQPCEESVDCAGDNTLYCDFVTETCEQGSNSCVDKCAKAGTSLEACNALGSECEMFGVDCARTDMLAGSCAALSGESTCEALAGCSWE
jgi:hypothetical protein